jgi:transposase
MTHDYKRNGTTTLFAALDVLTGSVIGECLPRHRHVEFLKFLRTIDREVPKRLQVHLILDNYATHNHPKVHEWLAKHPRFELHFTPTSSSWLNMVEIFHSVPDLIDTIATYLAAHNENPKPFQWTATSDQILEKVRHGRVTLNAITN